VSKKWLISVLGPTASGKTGLAILLAKHFGADIFSADSRQFYQELNIGVARPGADELEAVRHHYIGHISIHDDYSAGDFEKEAQTNLDTYFRQNNVGLLVGGSGLFVKAVLEGLDHFPLVDQQIREKLNKVYEEEGLEPLLNQLAELDADTLEHIDTKNHRRVIRALEVCLQTGMPFSSFKSQRQKSRPFTTVKLAIDWPREELYNRINTRVDEMLKAGLVEEARSVFPFRSLNSLNTVGYSELFDMFEGKCSMAEAIDKIKQHTRNYAKRQLTWLRKDHDIHWINPSIKLNEITSILAAKGVDADLNE